MYVYVLIPGFWISPVHPKRFFQVVFLLARLPNYRVRMGFGLHSGWAIEAPYSEKNPHLFGKPGVAWGRLG